MKVINNYHESGYTNGLDFYISWYGLFSSIPGYIRKRYMRYRVDSDGRTLKYFYTENEALDYIRIHKL